MFEKNYHLYLSAEEHKLAFEALNNLRNALIEQGRYTDAVDELIFKLATAKQKAYKIKYV